VAVSESNSYRNIAVFSSFGTIKSNAKYSYPSFKFYDSERFHLIFSSLNYRFLIITEYSDDFEIYSFTFTSKINFEWA
jgi:hypothetical protein